MVVPCCFANRSRWCEIYCVSRTHKKPTGTISFVGTLIPESFGETNIYGILQKYKSQVVSSITFCVVCMFCLLLDGSSKKQFVWKLPQNTILGLKRVKIYLQTKQFILFCFVYRSVTHISKFPWLKVKFTKRYTFHCSTALLKSHRGENKTLSNILNR